MVCIGGVEAEGHEELKELLHIFGARLGFCLVRRERMQTPGTPAKEELVRPRSTDSAEVLVPGDINLEWNWSQFVLELVGEVPSSDLRKEPPS